MSVSANLPPGRTCIVCAKSITVHEEARGGLCSAEKCRRDAVVRLVQRRAREAFAALQVRISAYHEETARQHGLVPEQLPFVRVPALERRTVKLPTRRKRRFRARLLKLINEAFEAEKNPESSKPLPPAPSDEGELAPEPAIFQAGCATCQGHCCRLGAPLAFLEATTVRRYLSRHPKLGPRDLLRLYLSKVPKTTVEYSCVYHGERGCGLPRIMRAPICNTYHCSGLKGLKDRLLEAGSGPILIVATTEKNVVRSSVYNETGQEKRFGHYPEQKLA